MNQKQHHLMMWIPCYNLPMAQRFLIAHGYGERMETKSGYAEVLRMATSRPTRTTSPAR